MPERRHWICGAIALALLLGLALPASAQNDQGAVDPAPYCTNEDGTVAPDVVITACNLMLQPGVLRGNALSAGYTDRGVAYDNLGDIDRALADFREAVRIDATNARAFKMLCIGTVAKKHDDKGVSYCDSAIRLDPASYEPFAVRAEWKYRNNDCDGSIADNTAAIRANVEAARLSQDHQTAAGFHRRSGQPVYRPRHLLWRQGRL